MIFGIIYPLILLNSTFKSTPDKLYNLGHHSKGIQFHQSKSRDGFAIHKSHVIVPKKFLITRSYKYQRALPSTEKRSADNSAFDMFPIILNSDELHQPKKTNEFLFNPEDILIGRANPNSEELDSSSNDDVEDSNDSNLGSNGSNANKKISMLKTLKYSDDDENSGLRGFAERNELVKRLIQNYINRMENAKQKE